MPEPHRDFAAEAVAERRAQAEHAIAAAFEATRAAIQQNTTTSRAQSIALTQIDLAEAMIEKLLRLGGLT